MDLGSNYVKNTAMAYSYIWHCLKICVLEFSIECKIQHEETDI